MALLRSFNKVCKFKKKQIGIRKKFGTDESFRGINENSCWFFKIKSISVDTEEDLLKVKKLMEKIMKKLKLHFKEKWGLTLILLVKKFFQFRNKIMPNF